MFDCHAVFHPFIETWMCYIAQIFVGIYLTTHFLIKSHSYLEWEWIPIAWY